jgi:hypothetical protein
VGVDVPGAAADALQDLEGLADRIEDAHPPSRSGRAAQLDLVAGIRSHQGALIDLAETAWRADHRRELEHLGSLDGRSAARWRSLSQLARKLSSGPSAPSPDTPSSSAASRHRLS